MVAAFVSFALPVRCALDLMATLVHEIYVSDFGFFGYTMSSELNCMALHGLFEGHGWPGSRAW